MQSDKRTKPNLVSLAIQEAADIMDFVVNLNRIRNFDISGPKAFFGLACIFSLYGHTGIWRRGRRHIRICFQHQDGLIQKITNLLLTFIRRR